MTKRHGEAHPKARLSDAEVSLVLALADAGLSYATIAAKFEVAKSCIAGIVQGRTRVYLTPRARRGNGGRK
jgi:hypothetical protein